MKQILIIGGGASGMAAALSAAASGASAVLIEAKEQLGKKLLRTGSGRCNFTNAKMDPDCYYGDRGFIRSFLDRFSTEDCLSFFRELGLLYRERDGYYYPYSNSASSVLSVLNGGLKARSVRIELNCPAEEAGMLPDGRFYVRSGDRRFTGDALIISAGSFAGGETQGRPFTSLLKGFPHIGIRPQLPALTMLYGNEGVERVWAGVRCRGAVTYGGRTETGELQLLDSGISGIPVFQLSRMAVQALAEKKEVRILLDLLPDFTEETLTALIKASGEKTLEDVLRGWLPRKLIPVLLRRAGLFGDRRADALTEEEILKLVRTMKAFSYRVTGHGTFRDAQTVSGGVDISCLTPEFEAKRIPGLFFTGETVDIDGICGGYNLHFAFGSGILAGKRAAAAE